MLSDPADFSIRHALIWFQGRPVGMPKRPIPWRAVGNLRFFGADTVWRF